MVMGHVVRGEMSVINATRTDLTTKCRVFPVLPQFWSSAGWLLLTAGSFTWRFPVLPEDVVDVEATVLLHSHLVGLVPGVIPTFLSCIAFAS
jgi:hypothetical protein